MAFFHQNTANLSHPGDSIEMPDDQFDLSNDIFFAISSIKKGLFVYYT
jgi:hypothetical protein